jgi:hypothetical protein
VHNLAGTSAEEGPTCAVTGESLADGMILMY